MPIKTPKQIGRYRILKKVGQGAMGVVFLGFDELIKRKVAIKSLRVDKNLRPAARQKAIDSFLHEARIVGNLNHSHITSVYDMGIQDGAPFIVMEFLDGKNIKELLQAKIKLPLAEKLTLLAMVGRALHYAHQRGILHRDIKPANIVILGKNHLPKITDFGIARVMDISSFGQREKTIDEDGFIPGTPLYMSPEQIRGDELDQRSDIFSLGVLAYEWLSGQKPFTGKNLNAKLQAVLQDKPRPLGKHPEIDKNLGGIIFRAIEKRRAERFQSAGELADTIDLYLNTLEKKEEKRRPTFSFDKKKVVDRLREKYLFFSDFSNEELFEVFRLSGKEQFAKGEHLIQEGTSGTKMYIIISGSIIILSESDGKRIELETLGEGSCVGEMSMIDRMPRSASVVAMKKTVALSLNETVLRHSNPKLCLKLYRNLATTLSERLRGSEAKYLDLLSSIHKERMD